MVPLGAVEAALGGVGEDAVVHGGGLNFFGDAVGGGKGLACGFVLDELEGEEQTLAPDVADVRMESKRGDGGAEMGGGCGRLSEKMVRFEIVQDSVAGGSGDGMGLVGEAVFEGTGTMLESVSDFGGDEDGPKRGITAGDALAS